MKNINNISDEMYVILREEEGKTKYLSWASKNDNLKYTYKLIYAKRFKTEDEANDFFHGELFLQHLEGINWKVRKVRYTQSVELVIKED